MNPEVKKVWIEALRSGRYTQIQGRLRDCDGFCCLGVLCDLGAQRDKRWTVPDRQGYQGFSDLDDNMVWDGTPPPDVLEKAGLSIDDMDRLAEYNDAGRSFEWIADWIRRKL